jgi:hypothetical protein
MGRFLRKLFVLALLLLGTAFVLDAALTRLYRQGRTVKAQWLSRVKGQHFDYAIAGSSRAWWNINVNTIDSACGLRGISLANNHFTPSEVLLSLKLFLAGGNTVDRILLQVDYRSLSDEQNVFSSTVYDYLPWLEDSIVHEHLAARSPEWWWLRRVPLARYVRYNFIWGPEEALVTLLGTRRTIFDSTGTYLSEPTPYRGWPTLELGPRTFSLGGDMQDIIALCREHGIRLSLFTAPYYRLRLPDGTEDRFKEFLRAEGLEHHDFTHRLDSTVYYFNNWHLGPHGGRRFTHMLVREVICPGTHNDPPGPPVP